MTPRISLADLQGPLPCSIQKGRRGGVCVAWRPLSFRMPRRGQRKSDPCSPLPHKEAFTLLCARGGALARHGRPGPSLASSWRALRQERGHFSSFEPPAGLPFSVEISCFSLFVAGFCARVTSLSAYTLNSALSPSPPRFLQLELTYAICRR